MKKKIAIAIWLLFVLSLFGCMTADKHFQKFLNKGGKVNCVQDSVIVVDTLVIDGDTILVPTVKYIIRDSISVETKWQTRYKYKTIKVQEKTKQIKAKEETKVAKSNNKAKTKQASKANWKFWVGCISGLLLYFLLYNLFNWIKRSIFNR